MWWSDSLDVFGYKIDIVHISRAIALFSFITLVLGHIKVFSKYNFHTHYNVGIRNHIQYYSYFS